MTPTIRLGSGSSALAQTQTSAPITSLKEAPVGPDGEGRPVFLKKQGSFFAGGTVVTSASGDSFHGDEAYVEFQIPDDARKLPMVRWHGGGQFSKTWESTPDGREVRSSTSSSVPVTLNRWVAKAYAAYLVRGGTIQ